MRTGSWRGPRIWPTLQRDGVRVGQLEVGEAAEELLDGHPQLQSGEVRAEAAVDAEPERGVAVLQPVDHDLVGAVEQLGSRLAAGNGSSTHSSAFIGQPWKSWSLATMRAIVTGA